MKMMKKAISFIVIIILVGLTNVSCVNRNKKTNVQKQVPHYILDGDYVGDTANKKFPFLYETLDKDSVLYSCEEDALNKSFSAKFNLKNSDSGEIVNRDITIVQDKVTGAIKVVVIREGKKGYLAFELDSCKIRDVKTNLDY